MRGRTTFYGWRIVHACMAIAVLSWGFGLFGTSVYLHATHQATGISIAALSSAISLSFFCSACAQIAVGQAIGTHGPRKVMGCGALCLAGGVAIIGSLQSLWQAYVGFLLLGMGWSCLSTTAISTTLAPWFEKHQGRAVSSAMLGASLGGMLAVPVLLFGMAQVGRTATMTLAAALILAIILPLAWGVLRKAPSDLGLWPDGVAPSATSASPTTAPWTRKQAMRTWALWSAALAFGLAQCVQIGFLTHHVSMLVPAMGAAAAAATVMGTGITAFLGRILLARFSDGLNVRVYSVGLLLVSAISLGMMAIVATPWAMVVGSLLYGLTLGNITTMGPITIRREFGAAAFGPIYGVAATAIQLCAATGPTIYGAIFEQMGRYDAALGFAALLNAVAAIVIYSGRRAAAALSR